MEKLNSAVLITLLFSIFFFAGCSNTFVKSVNNETPIIVQPSSPVVPVVNTTIPEKVYYVRNNFTNLIFLPESTILVTPKNDVLLFGAGSTSQLTLLNQVLGENNITKIKYLILPVPLDDSSSYLSIRYKPYVYYTGIPSKYESFKKYASWSFVDSRKVLDTDVFVEIIPSYSETRGLYPDNFGNSLVLKIVDGSNSFLLIDQCSIQCQQSIVETANVLQTRTSSFDLDFLTRVKPLIAMNAMNVSVNQLSYLGIKIYEDKKIYTYSDGSTLQVNP